MDSAVRNALMTEYTEIIEGVQLKLAGEIGADGWEISAHEHCAVDHIDIQGHIFTNEEFEKLQNHEDAVDIEGERFQLDRAIGDWNCRHIAYPFLTGISEPSFSKKQLADIQARNEAGVDFHGKHYTLYDAEQLQRRYETEMRKERENNNLLKQVRDVDPVMEREYQQSRTRLAGLREGYKELGAVLAPHSMRMKMERSYVPKGAIGGLQPISVQSIIEKGFKTNSAMGAMATRFYVKTGMKTEYDSWHIKEGSYVTGVKVIAQGTEIRDVQRLIKTYPMQNGSLTNEKDWYKVRGNGTVTDNHIERNAELHWYQCKNIGKVEFKVKRYFK
jgi:hypothetical protein